MLNWHLRLSPGAGGIMRLATGASDDISVASGSHHDDPDGVTPTREYFGNRYTPPRVHIPVIFRISSPSGTTWSTTTDFRRAMRASVASLCTGATAARADARVVLTTAPGKEAQVDYGDDPMVSNRGAGKYRRTRLFVLTLECSRKSDRLLVERSSAQIWAEPHERAFRRLGGTVRVIILDDLKEGVLTPDIRSHRRGPVDLHEWHH